MLDILFAITFGEWDLPTDIDAVVNWVKSCGQFSVEFEEGSEATLVFVPTWDRVTFRRVCVTVLSKYSGEASRDAAVHGQLLSVVGPSVLSVVCCSGWGFTCASRPICRNCWERVPEKIGRAYQIRLAASQQMPSEVGLSCFWQSRSVFVGGVHHCQTKAKGR